ncbi:MAG TPA: hypothetical protein VME44_06365 [Streptosporangiaceae bacterium]|nr:hypothetical protein [Streptosporangiaceae bacterium]
MPIRTAAAAQLLTLLLLVIASPAASAATAASSPRLPAPLWLVKSNDLALLQRQAAADGATLPPFATWVGCGGKSDPDRCSPGQQPIFTSYVPLRRLAMSGWHGTAVFDIEPWVYTPRPERRNPGEYICLAAHLAKIDPSLRVIITPFIKPTKKIIQEDVVAAKCGAAAVDVQSQFANGFPVKFGRFIRKAVIAIRKVNRRIIILAGLATNNPHVQLATDLIRDYDKALRAGIQGFWLNAKNWGSRNRCTATEGGPGCPQVGITFLEDIGLIGGK